MTRERRSSPWLPHLNEIWSSWSKVFHSKIVLIVTYDLAIHSPQNRTMDGVRIAPWNVRKREGCFPNP